MTTVFDIDKDFFDKVVAAIAARHEGEKVSDKQIKSWFEYAARVSIAHEDFWKARDVACENRADL